MAYGRMGRRLRRAAASVLALVMLAGAGGCTSPFALPTSGEVHGLTKSGKRTQRVFTSPHGPEDGAQPDSIVRGFLAALPAGPQSDGFAVAREFLTDMTANSWNPSRRTIIYDSDPIVERKAQSMAGAQTEASSQSLVTVSLNAIGQLDDKGVYTASMSSGMQQLDFRLVQVDGQWRIYDLPSGIAILQSDFDMVFKQVTLYQPDLRGASFIPDVRWFGWRNWRTEAVKQLLADPPQWLADIVGHPAGNAVSLSTGAVSVVDTMPSVTLSAEVMRLGTAERATLVRQLRLTLGEGKPDAPLEVLSASGNDLSDADNGVAIGIDTGTHGTYVVSSDAVIAIELPNLLRVGVLERGDDMTDFAFAPWGGAVARADGEVDCLTEDVSECGRLFTGTRTGTLAIGADHEIWASTTDALMVWNQSSETLRQLDATWLKGRQVIDMEIAPEGGRVVLAVRDGTDNEIMMAGVRRGSDGMPVALSESPVVIAHGSGYGETKDGTGQGFVFFDPTTLVVMITADDDGSVSSTARSMATSGPMGEQNSPEYLSALAGGRVGATNGLFALDTLGVLRSMTGSLTTSWRLAASQVEIAYGR